jgi:hypothetical protein
MKMSWGNCTAKMSSLHGDFHDEPEGGTPRWLGDGRLGRPDHQRGRAAALQLAPRQFQTPQAALSPPRVGGAAPQGQVHHLAISRESVRRLRRALGLEGSAFDWLEGRGPRMTLLGAIDDATSEVMALHFRPTEDLHGYATLLHQVFTTVGLPPALYGDGGNILVRTDRHWSLDEQLAGTQAPTHLGRVLQELGIGLCRRAHLKAGPGGTALGHPPGPARQRTAPAGDHPPGRQRLPPRVPRQL